jgi:hypothetical protein
MGTFKTWSNLVIVCKRSDVQSIKRDADLRGSSYADAVEYRF